MYYLITIHCSKKLHKVTSDTIQKIVDWLTANKVNMIDYVLTDHGQYRQLHYHAIAAYKGRYSILSKKIIDGINYQINWKPMGGNFTIEDACKYLNRNEKPIGVKWEEDILKLSQEKYLFV